MQRKARNASLADDCGAASLVSAPQLHADSLSNGTLAHACAIVQPCLRTLNRTKPARAVGALTSSLFVAFVRKISASRGDRMSNRRGRRQWANGERVGRLGALITLAESLNRSRRGGEVCSGDQGASTSASPACIGGRRPHAW